MEILKNNKTKTVLRGLFVVFYLIAGINHFIHPEFYFPLIPAYFPNPKLINWASGVFEILIAVGVIIPRYRKIAIFCTLFMLIAFIPSHLYFIQEGACMGEQSLCTPIWVAWIRLFPIHPLLMLWAWYIK